MTRWTEVMLIGLFAWPVGCAPSPVETGRSEPDSGLAPEAIAWFVAAIECGDRVTLPEGEPVAIQAFEGVGLGEGDLAWLELEELPSYTPGQSVRVRCNGVGMETGELRVMYAYLPPTPVDEQARFRYQDLGCDGHTTELRGGLLHEQPLRVYADGSWETMVEPDVYMNPDDHVDLVEEYCRDDQSGWRISVVSDPDEVSR